MFGFQSGSSGGAGSGAVSPPTTWTTMTRPATPTSGLSGFNSTLKILEFWDGTGWKPLSQLPGFADNVFLEHFDNGNSTSFVDSSSKANTITGIGGGQTTAKSKFGPSSFYADDGNYVTFPSTNLQFGTGDFTIEFWYFYTNAGSHRYGVLVDLGSLNMIQFASDPVQFYIALGATNLTTPNHNMVEGQWNFVTLQRKAGISTLAINGDLIGTFTSLVGSILPATPAYIGTYSGNVGNNNPGGYFDEIRVTAGARYESFPFSVPAASFANS
jgi:hypothetical protein